MPHCITASLLVLLLAGCASAPVASPLSGDPAVDEFAREVAQSLEAHAWGELLALPDPEHYRVQVSEGGMGEAQYLAELFGLHTVGNNIKRGETVTWADLERIESVTLTGLTGSASGYRLEGRARIAGGGELELQARIIESDGRLRLSGAVG